MGLPEPAPLTGTHTIASVLIPPGSTVLDVGCNGGDLGAFLSSQGCTVDGLDINPELVAKAAQWCRRVIVADVTSSVDLDAELSGERYDVVCCLDVLEHLPHPAKVLRRVSQLLRPGGRTVISIPNVTHASSRLQLLGGSFRYTDQGLLDRTHIRFFDRAELEKMVADAGMVVTDRLYVRRGMDETEIEIDSETLPDEVRAAATSGPDADVYQFVWSLAPVDSLPPTLGAEAVWHELELVRARAAEAEAEVRSLRAEITGGGTPAAVSQVTDDERIGDLALQVRLGRQAIANRDRIIEVNRAQLAELSPLRDRLAETELLLEQARQDRLRAVAKRRHGRNRRRAAERRRRQAEQRLRGVQQELATERGRLSYRVSARVIRILQRRPLRWFWRRGSAAGAASDSNLSAG